jgi:hypothetical protein
LNYIRYINSDAWKLKKEQAFAHYGRRCSLCGRTSNLTVHHNTYKNLGHEPMSDLCVLCWPCHKRHHRKTDAILPKDVLGSLTRGARKLLRRLDLAPQSVPLTSSERKRRKASANKFLQRLAKQRDKRRKRT